MPPAIMTKTWFIILQSQIFALVFSSVMTFASQYRHLFWVFIFAYIIIMSLMTTGLGKRIFSKKEYNEIAGSRKLIEVKRTEVYELMMKDTKLSQELRPQFRASMYSFLIMFVILGYFWIYSSTVLPYTSASEDVMIRFLGYLIMYEIPIGINTLFQRFVFLKAMSQVVQIPYSYTVYEKGITGSGVLLKFPLENVEELKTDLFRKFVEVRIRQKSRRTPSRIRFYTKNVERLSELIRKYGKVK